MSGKKKNNTKKRSTVVKEKDIIKESDFEDYNSDNKKIFVVALILALLIGGFAYIRSLDNKPVEENPNVEEPNNQEEVLPPIVEDKNDNNNNYDNWNNYEPITTPVEEETKEEEPIVDIWEVLNDMPLSLEAGSEYELPEVIANDNGEEIKAVVTYKFKSNEEDSEYTTVTEFDKTIMGTYLITYTINYTDGKVETKEVEIAVVDTVEPIINGITNESYLNEDIVLDITEYSPYIVELNGEVYDETLPITVEGEYTLTVTEDIVDGKSISVKFTLDKTLPEIIGVEDNGHYNSEEAIVITVADANLDTVIVTHNDEEITFENGITEIVLDGIYKVTVTDLAGNSVTYTFTIDRVAPTLEVSYTPDNELTNDSVTVVITADEEIQSVDGWTLSEDKLDLTKEFSANATENIEVYDLAGNKSIANIVVDNIYTIEFSPKLTLENLVANKVKATITSLKQLTLNEEWIEVIDGELYKYEKIYDESGIEVVNYTDSEENTGTIEVNIEITLDEAFVEYVEDDLTQDVTVYVTTEEEVLEENIPEGWILEIPTIDSELQSEITSYRYYKKYTENIEYELVEFITENKHYAVTIVIDSIDRDKPVVNAEITYNTNEETLEKESVVITITADEEIQEVEGWVLGEDKKTISQTILRPADEVSTEEQVKTVTIKDIKGNATEVEYSYNWN